MMSPRFRLLYLVACGLFGQGALAQDTTGGTGASSPSGSSPSSPPGSTGAGASSSFGAPSTGNTTSPFGSPSSPPIPSAPTPSSPSFGTGEAAPGTTPGEPGTTPGAASNFGTEQPGSGLNRTPPTTFTVPGSYGRGPQEYIVGQGRLARPKFRFHGNLSTGYDDNVFQTPTHPASVPDQTVVTLVRPGVPTQTVNALVPSGDPLVPDEVQEVEIPGSKPKFHTEKIPGIPPPERIGSFVTRTSLGFDMQLANRRNLFTFDFDAGNSYYWDRPGKKSEYNGTTSLVYLRKLTGRAQFTMSFDASYQSQPNFSQPNQPTSNNRGSYLTANAKADLSYRLTPRFSSVTSVGYNSLYSAEKTQRNSDYSETTFGTELRYLFSPRLTLLGELRYSSSLHQEDSTQDTSTYFLLIGGELTLTRRFSSSLRIGESLQTYDDSGHKSSSPYLEATLDYRLARGTTVRWNGRYGYEESGSANVQSTVARSGLALTQIFSPRLQASVSLNLIHNELSTTSEVLENAQPTPALLSVSEQKAALIAASNAANAAAAAAAPVDPNAPADAAAPTPTPTPAPKTKKPATPRTKTIVTDTTQDTIDATVGFHYTLDRHWSFNLNYTYTMVLGPESTFDYYRQQIFLGAEFQF